MKSVSPTFKLFAVLAASYAVCSALATGCRPKTKSDDLHARPPTVSAAVTQTSQSCRECHQPQFDSWAGTDHALANRPVDPVGDASALASFAKLDPAAAKPEFILGQKPLWQPLIPGEGGRWQPHELAFDPHKKEWFNAFGKEDRHAGEWGHWTGRGMNWNSMCAHCHMTGYERRYDATTDTFHSTWVEHGVGCIQCHGTTPAGHGDKKNPALTDKQPPFFGDRGKMMQTCAPCHARNELLTDKFQPGDNYHDHYRVTLPVDATTFYPDGQQRDEDFSWTSVLLSRMGHAGVTCMDCHNPHTLKTILPVNDNQLCQQCHSAPGRVMPGGARAVPIDPLKHSFHAPGSAGNSCVACHMPTTTYMQRAPRHDHGWLKPDPLMTKELGIPNACTSCHQDQSVDWAIEKTNEWYGPKMNSRQRDRARVIASAQAGSPGAADALLALLEGEDIPAWRATYLSLLPGLADFAKGRAASLAALNAANPLERAAGVRFFTGTPEASATLTPLLKDPVRLVRLDAAWALSPELPVDSAARRELDDYLKLTLDQPGGRLRLGQDLANRGNLAAALPEMTQAAKWDPFSPGILDAQGVVLAGLGRSAEAGNAFYRAAQLAGAPGAPLAMRAGLAFAEAGRLVEAENSFRLAIQLDANFHRARYNLALLLAQAERLPEAAELLRAAEKTAPEAADYPYALATILLRAGDHAGAREAAARTLRLDPSHRGASQVLRAFP
jgi:tetratricopeptide (TPR) repeat protein